MQVPTYLLALHVHGPCFTTPNHTLLKVLPQKPPPKDWPFNHPTDIVFHRRSFFCHKLNATRFKPHVVCYKKCISTVLQLKISYLIFAIGPPV